MKTLTKLVWNVVKKASYISCWKSNLIKLRNSPVLARDNKQKYQTNNPPLLKKKYIQNRDCWTLIITYTNIINIMHLSVKIRSFV